MGFVAPIALAAAGLWSWGYPLPSGDAPPASIFEHPPGIAGTATATGSLDKEVIRRVIRGHLGVVQACYDAQLDADPGLFGRVLVQFTIGATGQVISSVLQNSTIGNAVVETCTVAAVRRWRFPKPIGGGIVIVSYPFVFVPSEPIVLMAGSTGVNRVELQPLGTTMFVHRSTDANGVPSNGLVAMTETGLLLVDTAWTPAQTEAILRWGDQRLKRPWIGAVITHDHADRAGGLDAVLGRKIPVSAADLTVEKLQRRGIRGVKALLSTKAGDVGVKDERGFEVFYPGPGHASDNIVLSFDSLLYGGCLIKSTAAEDLGFTGDADLASWPAAVRRVQERYAKKMVVPGHGPVDETGAALEHTLRLLEKAR